MAQGWHANLLCPPGRTYLFRFSVIIRFVIQRLGGSFIIPILICARMCGFLVVVVIVVVFDGHGILWRKRMAHESPALAHAMEITVAIVQTGTPMYPSRRHHYGVAAVAVTAAAKRSVVRILHRRCCHCHLHHHHLLLLLS